MNHPGLARAKELVFRARRFGAQDAAALGVVHSAHDTSEALEEELRAVLGDVAKNVRACSVPCRAEEGRSACVCCVRWCASIEPTCGRGGRRFRDERILPFVRPTFLPTEPFLSYIAPG